MIHSLLSWNKMTIGSGLMLDPKRGRDDWLLRHGISDMNLSYLELVRLKNRSTTETLERVEEVVRVLCQLSALSTSCNV